MNFSCRGLLLMAVLLMAACNQRPSNERQVGAQPRIFPDYVGVTVPADIAPLNFAMADDSVTRIDVTLQGDNGGSLHVNGTYADFPLEAWHELLQRNRGSQLRVSVAARRDGHWTRYSTFLISVSEDSIGAQAVSYRRIAPGYEQYGHMGIYERRLGDFTETTLVDNAATPGQCINCHTSNGGRSNEYVYHARGEKPGTFLLKGQGAKGKGQDPENIATEDSRDLIGGAMVYPGWHPGGRYIAFSTNKTSQMFHLANAQKRIEVYDASSDVFVYDIQTRSVLRDTLTNYHQLASVSEMEFTQELHKMDRRITDMQHRHQMVSLGAIAMSVFAIILATILILLFRKNSQLRQSNTALYRKNVQLLKAETPFHRAETLFHRAETPFRPY